MIFTRHAVQRYRQFHMLDQPTATDDDAYDVLMRHGPAAVLSRTRTHRGDPVWMLEALGAELVCKHENGTVTCVTVLPPPRFRGLTPLQAERVADSHREARERAEAAQRVVAETSAAMARAIVARRVAAAPAAIAVRKTELAMLQADLSAAKRAATFAVAERDSLGAALKTMRHQLTSDETVSKLKAALKVAVRRLMEVGDEDGLAAIAAVDPGLASVEFVEIR
jgi:hypothetical protein